MIQMLDTSQRSTPSLKNYLTLKENQLSNNFAKISVSLGTFILGFLTKAILLNPIFKLSLPHILLIIIFLSFLVLCIYTWVWHLDQKDADKKNNHELKKLELEAERDIKLAEQKKSTHN